jgi:two-component system, cell cycle sensor histidine kinase and response regulator CckA
MSVPKNQKTKTTRKRTTHAFPESGDFYQILFEEATDSIFITDSQRKFVSFNKRTKELTGYSARELLGMDFTDLIPQEDLAKDPIRIENIRHEIVMNERRIRRKDGTLLFIEVSGRRLPDGRLFGIARDITKRKRVEDDLRNRTQQLEALRLVSIEITNELDLSRLLGLIHRKAAALLGVKSGFLSLYDDNLQMLTPYSWEGHGEWAHNLRYRLGEGISGTVAANRSGMVVKDYRNSPYVIPLIRDHTTVTSVVAEPLIYRDQLLGVVTIDNEGIAERTFTEEDRAILNLFAAKAAIAIEHARLFETVNRELTEKKRIETELARVNKQLRMLSDCNQALIRAISEEELLSTICSIVVQAGGYRMSWVIYADDQEAKTVRSMASAGYNEGFIENECCTWDDSEQSHNPMCMAIRTGVACTVQNIASDEAYKPWRTEAMKRGYAAICGLPLVVSGQTIGALGVYSTEPNAFDPVAVAHLYELANNLSLGITTIRTHTKRASAEESLLKSEKRFRQLVLNSNDIITVMDANGLQTYLSGAVEKILGYKPEELLGTNAFDLIHLDDLERVRTTFFELMRQPGSIRRLEFRSRHKNGFWTWVETVGINLADDAVVHGVVLNTRDISERKVSEKALLTTLQRFYTILSNLYSSMLLVTNDGKVEFANQPFCDYFHLQEAPEELHGLTAQDIIKKIKKNYIDPDIELKRIREIVLQGKPVKSEEVMMADGRTHLRDFIPISLSGSLYGRLWHHVDITERKQTEMVLQDSRERLDLALHSANMGVWRWEIAEDKRYWDDQTCRLLGMDTSRHAKNSEDFFNAVHREDREKVRSALAKTIEQNAPYEMEYRAVWPDGSVHVINSRGKIHRDGDGQAVRIVGTLWDVTDRKKAEQALYERNALLGTILQASPAAMYVLDREGVVLIWNKEAERMFGWSQEEAAGRPLPIVPGERLDEFRDNIYKLAHGTPLLGVEAVRQKKDGSPISIRMSAAPIYGADQAVNGIIIISMDLTNEKKMEMDRAALEHQLRQSQKMEAIGQLAGGVAHDFNNILSAIVGYAHLSSVDMKEDDPNRYNIQQILAASERATVLTQGLLAFSRKQTVNLSKIEMNDVVTKFEKLLRRLVPESIELKTTLSEQTLSIMADRGQIEQVLMNLVTNARDAMPTGGRILVETGQVTMDQSFIHAHGFGQAGDYALLSVSDSGIGIQEDIRSKIFDPFFTTKEEGKGTGLGLSMVYGIIKKHDGYIDVYSQVGIGTTFKIYLPMSHVSGETREEIQDELGPLRGGNETILLAEDDAAVRTLLSKVLHQHGYTVIEAVDGLDAVAKFRDNQNNIQIVVLDGIMPKLNGKDAWMAIKSIIPNIKAIFISGYARDIFEKDGFPRESATFIQKPCSPTVLAKKIREILDK